MVTWLATLLGYCELRALARWWQRRGWHLALSMHPCAEGRRDP